MAISEGEGLEAVNRGPAPNAHDTAPIQEQWIHKQPTRRSIQSPALPCPLDWHEICTHLIWRQPWHPDPPDGASILLRPPTTSAPAPALAEAAAAVAAAAAARVMLGRWWRWSVPDAGLPWVVSAPAG